MLQHQVASRGSHKAIQIVKKQFAKQSVEAALDVIRIQHALRPKNTHKTKNAPMFFNAFLSVFHAGLGLF